MVELSQTAEPYEKCSFYFIQSLVCGLFCSYLYVVSFSIFTIELVDNLATGREEEIKI